MTMERVLENARSASDGELLSEYVSYVDDCRHQRLSHKEFEEAWAIRIALRKEILKRMAH